MKQSEKTGMVKNVSSSWLMLAVNVGTGIVISPYILHKLGDDAFGLWVLIFAVTGYYGLFDFGIRSSIVRFVAKFHATGEHEEMNRLVSTGLFSYSIVGVFLVCLTAVGSLLLNRVFHILPGYMHTAKLLFWMVGVALALGFPLGVFGGVLEGLQKFYLLNFVNIVITLFRATLIIIALKRGQGLLTVAFITVIFPIVNQLWNAANVFRLERLRLGLHNVNRQTFRQMFNYGSITFTIAVADKLRFKTDALVIGSFLSAGAITQFAIPSRIVEYSTQLVDSLAQIFMPMSSHHDAKGDFVRLRSVFIAGNRACALIMFPVCAGLILLGKSVIQIWMGARYVAASYPVLLVILIPVTLRMSQAASGRVLFGMARHKTLAMVTLAEGVANLFLSILLVRHYGVIGDALGTAIPLTCTCIFFLPFHLGKILQVSVWTFLTRAYKAPLLMSVPLIVVLLLLRRWFVPHTLIQLAFQVGVAGAVYAGFVYWFMFVKGPLNFRKTAVEDRVVTDPLQELAVATVPSKPQG
jgi:O-antigen/teichoic acid export membrane protein